ncbi:unnamed protein product [Diabrotica balteata]|uniref:Major facilitator superfamily (MFS) profile domain-containing protein n=1 Tax=Diabrotica balteata TaxID=107213 RepID=A0A9P0E0B7_DIABA|nr:unnamed protein product [Diabrotica balteata]
MENQGTFRTLLRNNIQVIISTLAGIVGAVSNGIHLGLSPATVIPLCNTSIHNISRNTHTFCDNNDSQNIYRTFYLLGSCIGVLLCVVSYKLSTKKLMFISGILLVISWIPIAVQGAIITTHAARILAGTCMSITLISIPKYIHDIGPQNLRNSGRFIYYGILFGVLLAYMLSSFISVAAFAILGAALALIQMVTSLFTIESPYFLVWNNKNFKAKIALEKLRNTKFVESELDMIINAVLKSKINNKRQTIFSLTFNKRSCLSIALSMVGQQFSGIIVFLMFLEDILEICDIKDLHNTVICTMFIIIIIIIRFLNKNTARSFFLHNWISHIACSLSIVILALYITLKSFQINFNNMSWIPTLSILVYATTLGFDKGYFPFEVVHTYYPYLINNAGNILATFIQTFTAWVLVEIVQRLTPGPKIYIMLYAIAILNSLSTILIKVCTPVLREHEKQLSRGYRNHNEEFISPDDVELKSQLVNLSTNDTANEIKDPKAMTVTSKENIFKGTFPQLVAVLAGTLTAISDGMQYGWTAPVLPILQGPDSPVKVTNTQAEWLENLLMLGSFSGLWITIYLVDKIGRKKSILLASFVTIIIWIVTAVAPRVEYIFVARAFAGSAGNMAFVATPMYIAEIAEQKIRGFLSSLIYLMMLVGILLIYSVAPFIPFYAHCILGGSLALTELIIFPFMPESPYYLLYKDKPNEALQSLKRLRKKGHDIEKELESIKVAVDRQKSERGRIFDLFIVPSNRRAIFIMGLLNAAQHFSSISVLLMNIHVILDAAGSIYIQPRMAAILFSAIMVMAASVACLTIDKYGRKTLLITSSLLSGLCLLVLAIYFSLKNGGSDTSSYSWIPIVCVMLYALTFKLGLGMVPIVLTAELFPTKMKAFGMTIADGFYVIASLLSLQVYQRLTQHFGLQYPFYVFSFSCFIAAGFTYIFIPETKGKTLEEIQMILKGNHVENKKGDCEN